MEDVRDVRVRLNDLAPELEYGYGVGEWQIEVVKGSTL